MEAFQSLQAWLPCVLQLQGRMFCSLPAAWEGTWAAGRQPCLLPVTKAGGALPGQQLPALLCPGAMGLAAPGKRVGVWTRRALGCEQCWWLTAARQGLLPKAALRLGSWQQDLQCWGGFVLFLVAFLKMVPFAILPVLRQNFSWQNPSKSSGN